MAEVSHENKFGVSFPVKSLPVRKWISRSGHCPDCGSQLAIVNLVCTNADCGLDANLLIEYRRVITMKEPAEADG